MENTKGSNGKRNFPIPVSNGIFEHREKIKDAIWLFLWYIDKTTVEKEGGDGGNEGLVLRGKPIPDSDIARDLQCSKRTVCTWRNRLADGGYIKATRAPYGSVVRVLKSKKWIWKDSARLALERGKNSASLSPEPGKNLHRETSIASQTGNQTDNLIKTIQDKTVMKTKPNQPVARDAESQDLVGRLAFLFEEKTRIPLGTTKEQRQEVARLASEDGEAEVIAIFKQWLERPQGTDGLAWPLAAFAKEYGAYRGKRAIETNKREEEERRLAHVRCPDCGGKDLLVRSEGTLRKCATCGSVFNAELFVSMSKDEDQEAARRHEEENQNAERIWAQIEETPEGAAIAEALLRKGPPNTRR